MEGTESAPPVTTHDIAAETLSTLESSAPAENLQVSESSNQQVSESEPEPLSEEEQLLREFGFKQATKPDGREHYIPRSKVLSMIASGLKRGTEKWESDKKTLAEERDRYKADLEEFARDFRGDERAFLQKLSTVDPRYQAFLAQKVAEAQAERRQDEMQEPDFDLDLGDGRRTYSADGWRKREQWLLQQAEKRIEERLKPLTQREQEATEREKFVQERTKQIRAEIAEMEEWPLFGKYDPTNLNDFQKEVVAAMKADPSLNLRRAYWKVAGPRMSTDRNDIRQQLIQEQNAAPKATAVSRSGAEPVKPQGTRSTRDIAAEVHARLNKG